MEIKDILPILLIAAFSIFGSLAKNKAKKKGNAPKKKNIFESLMDEIQQEINPEPPLEMETSSIPYEKEEDSSFKSEIEDIREKYNQQTEPKREQTHIYESMHSHVPHKPILRKKKKKHKYALNNLSEAKKAIIYSEILKPRHHNF